MTHNGVTPAAVARRASKVFSTGDGVFDLDLVVPAGSIFGFIGPSGSGKTTTVRLLTGIARPTSGSVEVMGVDSAHLDAATRSRIGYLPQESVLYPNLTVKGNLRFFASLYGLAPRVSRKRRAEVLEFVELDGHASKPVSKLSGGMKRRLSLAAAFVHGPDTVFLDEPTAGVDPVLRRRFWDQFAALRDQGRTLFVTTQYVGEAAYCDYVGVLSSGRLLLVETPDGLRRAAYGGDVVVVDFAEPPSDALVVDIRRLTGAAGYERLGLHKIRLVVHEAAVALPELTAWLAARDIKIEQAEEWLPPFDDVFVELVERHRNGVPEGEGGAGA